MKFSMNPVANAPDEEKRAAQRKAEAKPFDAVKDLTGVIEEHVDALQHILTDGGNTVKKEIVEKDLERCAEFVRLAMSRHDASQSSNVATGDVPAGANVAGRVAAEAQDDAVLIRCLNEYGDALGQVRTFRDANGDVIRTNPADNTSAALTLPRHGDRQGTSAFQDENGNPSNNITDLQLAHKESALLFTKFGKSWIRYFGRLAENRGKNQSAESNESDDDSC